MLLSLSPDKGLVSGLSIAWYQLSSSVLRCVAAHHKMSWRGWPELQSQDHLLPGHLAAFGWKGGLLQPCPPVWVGEAARGGGKEEGEGLDIQ